jgi:hypothetical protein
MKAARPRSSSIDHSGDRVDNQLRPGFILQETEHRVTRSVPKGMIEVFINESTSIGAGTIEYPMIRNMLCRCPGQMCDA